MGAMAGQQGDIHELKMEISALRSDLKRFIERANQQHVGAVLGDLKRNYAGLFSQHQVDSAKTDLSLHMVAECAMREKCYEAFLDFLQNTAMHIKDGQVSDEIIQSYRKQMKVLRKKGPYERCDTCFSEVHRLFEKQIDLMQSLGIYQIAAATRDDPVECNTEGIVCEILEPFANIQRFQIVKALATATRTFSDLSQLTGLRAGNLLFHLKKLQESGMILQRHERGDYAITEKGFRTFRTISDLYAGLAGSR